MLFCTHVTQSGHDNALSSYYEHELIKWYNVVCAIHVKFLSIFFF